MFGSLYCRINNFVSYMSVSASVFTLLAISNDRRKVIVRPLSAKPGKLHNLLIILSIWVLSCAIAVPAYVFSEEVRIRRYSSVYLQTKLTICWRLPFNLIIN